MFCFSLRNIFSCCEKYIKYVVFSVDQKVPTVCVTRCNCGQVTGRDTQHTFNWPELRLSGNVLTKHHLGRHYMNPILC